MKPRFSIRDLFWLVLVVALAVVWWLDHAAQARKVYESDIAARMATAQKEVAEFDLKLRQQADKQFPKFP
jgi:hypothetical protein